MTSPDPRPMLDLPPDEREIAFRAIEGVLREYPVLDRVVKTWRSREGFAHDLDPPAFDAMPMVALSPVPNPTDLWGVDELKVNLGVSVQLFVPGTCSADILGLWRAVERAIASSRVMYEGTAAAVTVRDHLCNVFGNGRGVINLRPLAPAFLAVDLARHGNDPAFQSGSGSLVCYFALPK